MLAKFLVAGLVIFEMLGFSILKLKSLQDSEMKRIKIVTMSHIPPLLQHYDHNANRSPKKILWKPDNCLSPCRGRTCSASSSDDCTASAEDGPEKETGFNVRHQVSETIQQCLEPWCDLRFWYSVLSFWSLRQDFHLTQIVEQWPVIAWENGKIFTDFLSCPPRTRPPTKKMQGNKYHKTKISNGTVTKDVPLVLFSLCAFLLTVFVLCVLLYLL